MIDRMLRILADRLGVEPARAGEALVPTIRFERAWPQGVTLLVVLASAGLIVWLYRREGPAAGWYRAMLATVRIALVLLTVFMLSEAVLSVDRTGLPYFVVMVDDSASAQIVDQYEDAAQKTAAEAFAQAVGKSEATRWAVARGILENDQGRFLREVQKQNRVRLYAASTSARLLAEIDRPGDVGPALERLGQSEPTGAQSRLGASVRSVLTELRGAPPSAVVLLSDGQTTDGEPLARAAELASRKGVPLYPVGLGSPAPARDLELTELLVDDVVFVDDLVRFQAKLLSRGFEGQEVDVRLKERPQGSSDPASAREIESAKVKAPADGQPARVELRYRPKTTGEFVYTLEVDQRPRELQADNNRIERAVNVRKEKLRVLLVDGDPRYEYRYLKNYLEREETIDLNVVLLSSDPEYSEQDRSALPAFPGDKDDLFRYDVIVLGDAGPSYFSLSQMQALSEFVTGKGGGLVFVAGDNFNPLAYRGTPIEPLLPIELADARNPSALGAAVPAFRPELTPEGRTSPIFRFGDDEAASTRIWQDLPELFWYLEAPRKKPAALVLAEHPTATGTDGKLPVFVYQFVGYGKTLFHAVDDTWRWRFRAGDRYFGRFWIQTLRFMARSKLLGQKQAEVSTDRRRYQRNQPVQVRVRFPNPGLVPGSGEVTVQITHAGQGPRKLSLKPSPGTRNVFEGAVTESVEGEYEVLLLPPPVLEGAEPRASFRVDAPASELEHIEMNQAELRRAATVSGGKFHTPASLSTLLAELPRPQKVPLDTDPPIPLWNTWPVLGLFLTLLVAEWVLRKRRQMV